MKDIFDVPIQFIEYSIEQGIKANSGEIKRYVGDLKQMYFVGQTLFLDTKDEFGILDVFTINHSCETFGNFNGGQRRLLTIKALRSLEVLMEMCNINYKPKELIN